MAPMVHGLEAQYFGQIKFSYIDADDPNTQEIQRSLGFNYQPEFYLLDGNGNVLKKWVGYVAQEEFEAEFLKALSQ
jgi:thioredoxin-related protein